MIPILASTACRSRQTQETMNRTSRQKPRPHAINFAKREDSVEV